MNDDLIQCPNCFKVGKKQILGRILEDGSFLILRFHHGTTIVKADKYSIVCGCGYEHAVGGTIKLDAVVIEQL